MPKPDDLGQILKEMRIFPDRIENIVNKLNRDQLRSRQKEDGWTVNQQIHHIADAQNMTYYRIKLVISNDYPTLIAFDQDVWMTYKDSTSHDVSASLNLIRGTYVKWADLTEGMQEEDWDRKCVHPETGEMTVRAIFDFYLDHGNSHLKNLEALL